MFPGEILATTGGFARWRTGGFVHRDGQVRLFDPAKGELIESLHGHSNAAFGIAFSPDGRRLISASGGREAIKLWDVGTRQELLTLGGAGSVSARGQMECRWGRDPRRPAVAGLARAVLGGNRRGGGEGQTKAGTTMNNMKAQLLLLTTLLVSGSSVPLPGQPAPAAPPYTGLYVFGDSWSGTNDGAYWRSRWSNGPMWYDILCTNWAIPYGAARNYAGGDGTTDDVVGRQVPLFAGASNAPTALFVVWACRNDIGVYLLLPDDVINTRALTNATGWSNLWVRMSRNISNSVVRLHRKGARTVIVPDLEEVQRMPFYYRINDSQTAQLREQLQAGNRTLTNTMAALGASLPNLRLLRLDFSRRWLEFLDQAVSLGFTRVDTGATLDPALKDKSYTGPGKDYVFWDWAHTTTRTHAVWAEWFNELATQTRTESLRLVVRSNSFDLELSKLKPGRKYTLETSDNLSTWTPQESFTAVEGTNTVTIAPASGGPTMRLFRLAW